MREALGKQRTQTARSRERRRAKTQETQLMLGGSSRFEGERESKRQQSAEMFEKNDRVNPLLLLLLF